MNSNHGISALCVCGTLFPTPRCPLQQRKPIYTHQQHHEARPEYSTAWAWCPRRLCKVACAIPERKPCPGPCAGREGKVFSQPARSGRLHKRSRHCPPRGTRIDQPTSDIEDSDSSTSPIDRSRVRNCRHPTSIHHDLSGDGCQPVVCQAPLAVVCRNDDPWSCDVLQGLQRERRRARGDREQAEEARAAECRAREVQNAELDRLLGEERELFRNQNTLLDSMRLDHERDSGLRQTLMADMRLEHERESGDLHALMLDMRQEYTREITQGQDIWTGLRHDLQQVRNEWTELMGQDQQQQQQMRGQWVDLLQAFQAQVARPIVTGATSDFRPRPHKG